jgi:hypothetical protein
VRVAAQADVGSALDIGAEDYIEVAFAVLGVNVDLFSLWILCFVKRVVARDEVF